MDKARQFIKDYTMGCSNQLEVVKTIDGTETILYHEWLTPEQALAAVEIAKEELIDKACEWLRTHREADYFEPISLNYCGAGNLNKKKMIVDFKKYMEK